VDNLLVAPPHGMPLRLPELQVLAELAQERQATTRNWPGCSQRTDAETRNILARAERTAQGLAAMTGLSVMRPVG
jgi:hypothetical protein